MSRKFCLSPAVRRWVVAAMLSLVTAAYAQSLVLEGVEGWLYPGWESLTEDNRTGVDQSVGLISDVQSALGAANIKIFVLVVPMKAMIYPEYLPSGEQLSDPIKGRYTYILAKLADARIATIDLRPVLLGVKANHLAFYRTDYHWTPWSAEATADSIAHIIDPTAAKSAGKTEQWREEKHFGDLANLLPREQRKRIGEERFKVRVEKSSGGLLDEMRPAIQVVGNSFVQPYLGFPQALGSALARPVGLSWHYGSVGPWMTLLQYLESDTFKRSRPRTILWQWNEAQFANGPDAAGQWAKESILPSQVWLNRIRGALER